MTAQTSASVQTLPGKPLIIALWVAQVVIFALFVFFGFTKITTPIPQLSQMMPWTGDLSPTFVRIMGLVDMAGGLGILLPTLTRVLPRLTVLAALGCCALQVCAIAFHSLRGEFAMLPLNFVLLAVVAFILWGRNKTTSKA